MEKDDTITAFFNIDKDLSPIEHLHVKIDDKHSVEGECERKIIDPVMHYARFLASLVDMGIPRRWMFDWYVGPLDEDEMYPVDTVMKRWNVNKDKLMRKMITGEYEVYTLKSDGMSYKLLVIINREIGEGAIIAPLVR